ncbi:hypothetical protein Tco_1464766 [Tanacetum coccineum]
MEVVAVLRGWGLGGEGGSRFAGYVGKREHPPPLEIGGSVVVEGKGGEWGRCLRGVGSGNGVGKGGTGGEEGRLGWESDTYTGNPVKEILLKLNLLVIGLGPHRSVEDQVMVEMEIPHSSGVNSQPHAHT